MKHSVWRIQNTIQHRLNQSQKLTEFENGRCEAHSERRRRVAATRSRCTCENFHTKEQKQTLRIARAASRNLDRFKNSRVFSARRSGAPRELELEHLLLEPPVVVAFFRDLFFESLYGIWSDSRDGSRSEMPQSRVGRLRKHSWTLSGTFKIMK